LKRLALFVLLAGLGVRGVSAQLAYYVDESGRRVYVNPEPKPDNSAQNQVATTHKRVAKKQPVAALSKTSSSTTSARAVPTPVSYTPPATPAPVASPSAPATSAVRQNAAHQNLDAVVEQTARRHDVDVNLVKAMIHTESNSNPRAVSNKGAMGLMQLMPFTARDLGVTNAFDPVQNVEGGVRYMKSLLTQFGGDLSLSLAAYNAGPGAVTRHGGIPPYRETQDYVKKIGDLYSSLRGQPKEKPYHGIVKTVDENGRVKYTNLP
jgi:soluble lytic murein transglycosylase-like protein